LTSFSTFTNLKSYSFLGKNHRVRKIAYYSASKPFVKKFNNESIGQIHYHNNSFPSSYTQLNREKNCIPNLSFFTEAQAHNTCLNRKLCIDAGGNIKNCPAMSRSFGNIKDTTLKEAIEKEGFKDLWFINKDKIDVCRDCEFRYMCMDCRCFIKDPENIYSQPAKCGYNPYICK
jgi:SPASM domain peptide maturase of grasp-with-spasm system